MPEIPPGLPAPTGPAAPGLSLPKEALPEGLRSGDALPARVVAQLGAGRYALSIGGSEVVAASSLPLSPGDQLQLVVRQAGTRVLMDLVPLVRPGAESAAAPGDAASGAQLAQPGTEDAPSGSASAKSVAAGLREELGRGAPLGGLLDEALRLLPAAEGAAATPAGTRAGAAPAGDLRELAAGLRQLILDPAAATGAALAEAAAAAPAAIAALLEAVETRMAAELQSMPRAAALDALIALLDSLPAGAGVGAGEASSASAASQGAALLDRLLVALTPSAAGPGTEAQRLPAALREALGSLSGAELASLRALAAEREHSALGASPQTAALGALHRALAAAQDRLDMARLSGLSSPAQGQGFSYLELPVAAGPETGTARLRVLVRGGGGGGGGRGRGRGTTRAVLDLDLSALGQVGSELALSGRKLAVSLVLPDEERTRFVAERLGELEERLAARGLEPTLSATRARPRRAEAAAGEDRESAEHGGLNLWA